MQQVQENSNRFCFDRQRCSFIFVTWSREYHKMIFSWVFRQWRQVSLTSAVPSRNRETIVQSRPSPGTPTRVYFKAVTLPRRLRIGRWPFSSPSLSLSVSYPFFILFFFLPISVSVPTMQPGMPRKVRTCPPTPPQKVHDSFLGYM